MSIPPSRFEKLKWQLRQGSAGSVDRSEDSLRRRGVHHSQGQPAAESRRASTRASTESCSKSSWRSIRPRRAASWRRRWRRTVSRSIASGRCSLERSLAGGWENQHVKENREIPVSEQLGYYQQNIADYRVSLEGSLGRADGELRSLQLQPEAYAALAEMGNDVLRGAAFAEVAKTPFARDQRALTAASTTGPPRGVWSRRCSTRRSSPCRSAA